ncbi:MAG TPA: ABC transporter permease [Terracidiphilus sp.]
MRALKRIFTRLRNFATDRRGDERLREEMEQHLAMRTEENIRVGMNPEEAHRQARLKFGAVEAIRGDYAAEGSLPFLENLLADIRFALRVLRKSPAFTIVSVLTLTLAIGANVVVFGVLNGLVLHPLAVPEGNRIYQVQTKRSEAISISYANYADIRDRNSTFSSLAIFRLARIGIGVRGMAQPVWGYEVSGNYFPMLRIKPQLGRLLVPADDAKENGSQVAVLSYACWKVRFGGDPTIVGRTVSVNSHPYTVIGVAPEGFNGTERFIWPEVWVPIQNEAQIEGYQWLHQRGDSNAWVVGRLKPGTTPAQADADLARVAAGLARQYPDTDKNLSLRVAKPGLLGDALGTPIRLFLMGVMFLAGLVLLAACTNLGGLFAARTADRARELGIRIAIGSSRGRILRQLVTEAVILASAAGVAATVTAKLLLAGITQLPISAELPVQFAVQPKPEVYGFAVLLALATGLLFGIIPTRQVWRTDPNQVLKASDTSNLKHRRITLRDTLLALQIALCCLLVTASFVAVRGLQSTLRVRLGFRPEGVVLATMDVHLAGYSEATETVVERRLLAAVQAIPGVRDAAWSNTTPLSINQSNTSIWAPGTSDFRLASSKFSANFYKVSPGYFRVAETHLVAGRVFTDSDNAQSPRVAIVNQTFAMRLFGTANVVGQHLPRPGEQQEIVGVVEDGKYGTLTEDPTPAIFWPILQSPESDTVLLIRSDRPASDVVPLIRNAVAGVDSNLPLFTLQRWPDALAMVTFPARAAAIALGILGALAMMLSITGIFGLAAYTVTRRMRELGIRVALGAHHMQVLQAALGRIALLLGLGSVAGLLLGAVASRLLASIVYGASAYDPPVIIAAVTTMMLIGLVSAALPARRALAAHPAQLLRDE